MARVHLTERFPTLLPLRRRQRIACFYLAMALDGSRYATQQSQEPMVYTVFASGCPMYNRETGFPMVYQENKVFNLKLAARMLDGLVIWPGETFSFWNRVRRADRDIPYKEGLAEINGKLVTQYGGGLCQISNLLCWLFLHTPLTMVERHGHEKKDFPEPPSDAPLGVDATVAEGWLDFRVRNDTRDPFRLSLTFDETRILGRIETDRDRGCYWRVVNRNLAYIRDGSNIYEEVDVVQEIRSAADNRLLRETVAYRNRCRIGYPLPPDTLIQERT